MFRKSFITPVIISVFLCLAGPAGAGDTLIDPDSYQGIAADQRAYRIGDPLTIVVVESALAESAADTGTGNDWEFGATARSDEISHEFAAGLAGNQNGTGQTRRTGRIRALIGAQIVGLDGEKMARVRGEQQILINGEAQTIVVQGLVRTTDIRSDNSILSSRLSRSEIEFTGAGIVSDAQKPGLIYSLLNWLGLI